MKTYCAKAGCNNLVERGYCEKHKQARTDDDPHLARLYRNKAWNGKCGVATAVKLRNPLCQKLFAEGSRLVRCRNASYLVHHRWSPRQRPELVYSVFDEKGVSQLIALCADCHPPDEGTPHWREAVDGPIPPGGGEFFIRTAFSIMGIEDRARI